ncbi:MAG: hypothetical protein KDK90_28355, partial [Leptospiraceae bacterium]|nr:hypothetical protein [Leptospiraceae bacterium]
LLGSKAEPYTYEDIGLTPENQAPEGQKEPSIPLMSDRERTAIKSYVMEMEDMDMMTEGHWKETSREAMRALSEIQYTDDEINNHLNDFLANQVPIPEPPRKTKEEVLRRETAAADRYYNGIKEEFPDLSNEQLIQIRIHLTLALVLIRFQQDYNDPDGLTPEILDMAKNKAVKFRQEINTELVKRGVTSL